MSTPSGNIDIREVLAVIDETIDGCKHKVRSVKSQREELRAIGEYEARLACAKIERRLAKAMRGKIVAYFENNGNPVGLMTQLQRNDPEFLESLGITFRCVPSGR